MNIRRHESFPSQFVLPRNVDVWLPPTYDGSARFPVLYMHDGQNIVEPGHAFGGVSWEVDKAITRLIEKGETRGAIVVGLWNHGDIRWQEYMPQKLYHSPALHSHHAAILNRAGGEPISDLYLKHVVQEVKPFIDATYLSLPDQANTFVMGSSMGGLISLYAISEYPHIFGGAGCVSTHWSAGGHELVSEMAKQLPDPATHKLYFDFGTQGLDAFYEPFQTQMDALLKQAGYTRNANWLTQKFEGADHNEAAWRARVEIPLKFLLTNAG